MTYVRLVLDTTIIPTLGLIVNLVSPWWLQLIIGSVCLSVCFCVLTITTLNFQILSASLSGKSGLIFNYFILFWVAFSLHIFIMFIPHCSVNSFLFRKGRGIIILTDIHEINSTQHNLKTIGSILTKFVVHILDCINNYIYEPQILPLTSHNNFF